MNNLKKELGERIRELRKAAELTQEKLGEKAELSYKFLGELERGQVNVSVDSLEKIAKALGVKIGDLFSQEKIPVQMVFKEDDQLSKLSTKDILDIKKVLKLFNRIFKT